MNTRFWLRQSRNELGKFQHGPLARSIELASGDACPRCGGWLALYCSKIIRGIRRRYVRCSSKRCRWSPGGPSLVSAAEFPGGWGGGRPRTKNRISHPRRSRHDGH